MQLEPQSPARAHAAVAADMLLAQAPRQAAALLSLHAQALAHERFEPAATAVLAELAVLLDCDRVSLGWRDGSATRIAAVSHGADLGAREAVPRAIADAMDEAIDQGLSVMHPLPRGSSALITLAHAQLARANGQASILTVPVAGVRHKPGAMLFERREAFDAASLELARDAALFVAPVLELKHRLDASLAARVQSVLHHRSLARRPWLLAAAALFFVFALWPVSQDVVSPARLEAEVQRVISAPIDGFVRSVEVRPGEAVKEGQLLLTLDRAELALERDKWAAEIAQADKQYRDALSKDEAAPIVLARSKLEQASSQYELVLRQLARTNLRAPFDGVLIGGDLSQRVGMPVKRGQELLTLAPQQVVRVVAEVDEQDIAALQVGQPARVLFSAHAGEALNFEITRVSPVATVLDGRNLFEVEGRLLSANAVELASLRPGLRGVARITTDNRSRALQWWQAADNAVRRVMWRLLG